MCYKIRSLTGMWCLRVSQDLYSWTFKWIWTSYPSCKPQIHMVVMFCCPAWASDCPCWDDDWKTCHNSHTVQQSFQTSYIGNSEEYTLCLSILECFGIAYLTAGWCLEPNTPALPGMHVMDCILSYQELQIVSGSQYLSQFRKVHQLMRSIDLLRQSQDFDRLVSKHYARAALNWRQSSQ